MNRQFDKLVKALSLAGALFWGASALAPAPAEAGAACPFITTGAQLSAAQWNFCFTAKQNDLGFIPINKAGDGMQGLLTTIAPTTAIAGFRLNHGVTPTSPVNGDLWTTISGLFVQINGSTIGPLTAGAAGSFAATTPLTVSFPASVVTYACATCVTSSGGGAITGTAPVAVSAAGVVSITGLSGGVLAGSPAAFTRTPVLGLNGTAAGTLGFAGATSGTVTVTPQAAAGTPTLSLPNTSGTFAVSATAPLAVSATTGNITCTTCVTSSGGGAITGTAPVAVSAAGVVSITGAAGQVLAGASPAFTATPTLGVAGATVGTLTFANLTSGSITISPPTGALGSITLTLPIGGNDTLMGLATAATVTGAKTYSAGALKQAGAGAGVLTVAYANSASSATITFPAGSTDFSATGGASQYLKQASAGGAITVGTIAAADLPGSFSGFANPLNPGVNLAGSNGVATTAMRSDAVLILDQTISPTWTGQHTHTVSRTIASATAAALDDVNVAAATTTITGNTGSPITRLAKVGIYRPTLTDASAVTVTDAATLYVDNSPLGAGSVTITNAWAIMVGAGASKFQATTIAGALTYGGVTLSNAVTGTGNMVLATSPSVSGLTVTGSFTATGLVGNAALVNPSTTVNGQTCTLGSTCTITATAASITTGTTTVASGVAGRVLFNNGTLGEYAISGTGSVAMTASPTFTGTVTAAAANFSGAVAITSSSATAFAAGLNGTTNPALLVDASTASSATGLKIKSAAAAGGVALTVITSGTNENLTIDAAGSGTVTINGTATGQITLNRSTTIGAALTYGGVTLANAVTGTGNMVLSAGPTFTGSPALSTPTATSVALGGCTIGANALCATGTANISGATTIGGAITYGGVTLTNAVTGTGSMVLSTNAALTTPAIGAATGASLSITGGVTAYNATAIPAGGTAGTGEKFSSTSNFGVFFGSGAPTLSAAQGSIYLRSDGAPFYNTNGTTGWASLASGSGTVTSVIAGTGLTGGTITTTGTIAVDVATTANIWAAAANKVLDAATVFNAAGALTSCTGTTTAACDFSAGFNFTFTATTATNYTLGNPSNSTKVGQTGCIYLVQPASGTVVTIAFGANWKTAGGVSAITLTATLGAIDRVCYIVRTSTFIDFSFANDVKT